MKMKRVLALLLCVLMVLTMLPQTAQAAEAGDFIVEGGALGTDYTYNSGDGGPLIFERPGTYTVSMKTPGTPTASEIQVAVGAGTEAEPVRISLNGVSIQSGSCAFELKENSYAELILMEGTTSELTSGNSAGISCLQDATLIIRGSGTLEARGGDNFAAGIGSGNTGACGNIIISGGTIKISGGTVYATSDNGAGIGGGTWHSNDSVEISGGSVYATSDNGAGIGGGGGLHRGERNHGRHR